MPVTPRKYKMSDTEKHWTCRKCDATLPVAEPGKATPLMAKVVWGAATCIRDTFHDWTLTDANTKGAS